METRWVSASGDVPIRTITVWPGRGGSVRCVGDKENYQNLAVDKSGLSLRPEIGGTPGTLRHTSGGSVAWHAIGGIGH